LKRDCQKEIIQAVGMSVRAWSRCKRDLRKNCICKIWEYCV